MGACQLLDEVGVILNEIRPLQQGDSVQSRIGEQLHATAMEDLRGHKMIVRKLKALLASCELACQMGPMMSSNKNKTPLRGPVGLAYEPIIGHHIVLRPRVEQIFVIDKWTVQDIFP